MPQTAEIVNDIKTVLDISSRVDERVKLIQINQQEMNSRFNQFIADFNQLSARVSVLESKNGGRVHALEDDVKELATRLERMDVGGSASLKESVEASRQEKYKLEDKITGLNIRLANVENVHEGWQAKVKQYAGLVIQGIWVIIVCYLLYRLGLNTAPLP